MTRFWKRHREEQVEALLKSNRPEPRGEFVAAVLERIEPKQRPFDVHGLGRRLVLAAIVTALAIGAAAAAGGINSASNGIGSLVSAAKKAVTPPPQANSSASTQGNQSGVNQSGNQGGSQQNGNNGNNGQGGDPQNTSNQVSPADAQYTFTFCHATDSDTNPYVQLTLPLAGYLNHIANHPFDLPTVPPGGCPTTENPGKDTGHP
jgi:hypothetical protein